MLRSFVFKALDTIGIAQNIYERIKLLGDEQ